MNTRRSSDSWRAGWRSGKRTVEGIAAVLSGTAEAFRALGQLLTRPVRVRAGSRGHEHAETKKLYREVKALHQASPLGADDREKVAAEIVREACERTERLPEFPIFEAMCEATSLLMVEEGIWDLPDIDWSQELGLEEGVELRKYLASVKRFFGDYPRYMSEWSEAVTQVLGIVLLAIPESIALDEEERGKGQRFTVSLADLINEPAELIEQVIFTLWSQNIVAVELFDSVRWRLERNALVASGIDPRESDRSTKQLRMPTDLPGASAADLVRLYLPGTPLASLFKLACGFSIPEEARFEHCHIVGGSGHGKTQLLQLMIHDDILRAQREPLSLCVLDSQGDLIRTISHLRYFSPRVEQSLADRFVLIDPNDTAFPVCLNLFAMRADETDDLARERTLNATVALYEYMFGALLGAELTQRQGVIFKYLARLMMEIPGATIHTLRALMEDVKPFRQHIEHLEGSARAFFDTQFGSKTFDATRKQILTRLWGVLSNSTFERMFSHERNAIDLYDAMQSGKIVLINTAKDLLQKEGSQIFGRFFIALITHAAVKRAAVAPKDRVPCFVYVDEAHEYFDEHVGDLLNQARKYRVGLSLAHQNLDQLDTDLRAAIMASTSVKIAGGVSAKDASALAKEMRCTADFIQHTRKQKTKTEFACYVRNVTYKPVKITVPLGAVERVARISERDYEALVARNRELYAAPRVKRMEWAAPQPEPFPQTAAPKAELPAPAVLPEKPVSLPPVSEVPAPRPHPLEAAREEVPKPEPATPKQSKRPKVVPTEPTPLGKGGKEHKYLQQLIKQIAESRGFKATIEQPVGGGTGSVDISLQRGDVTVACEVSVTSTPEQELANVRKCLAAGYGRVLLVSADEKRLKKHEKAVSSALEDEDLAKVAFLTPAACADYLGSIAPAEAPAQTVRGYKVRLQYQALGEEEQARRREAIAKVVLQSIRAVGGK